MLSPFFIQFFFCRFEKKWNAKCIGIKFIRWNLLPLLCLFHISFFTKMWLQSVTLSLRWPKHHDMTFRRRSKVFNGFLNLCPFSPFNSPKVIFIVDFSFREIAIILNSMKNAQKTERSESSLKSLITNWNMLCNGWTVAEKKHFLSNIINNRENSSALMTTRNLSRH